MSYNATGGIQLSSDSYVRDDKAVIQFSRSICVLALATLSGVAGAQATRYRATLISDWGAHASMNNLGQILMTDSGAGPSPRPTFLWSPNGTTRSAPARGVINDNGDVLYRANGQFRIWNLNTQPDSNFATGTPLQNPNDSLNHWAIGINNNRMCLGGGTFSNTVNYVWASPTSPVEVLGYQSQSIDVTGWNNQNRIVGVNASSTKGLLLSQSEPPVELSVSGNAFFPDAISEDGRIVGYTGSGNNNVWRVLNANLTVQHLLPQQPGWLRTGYGRINRRNEMLAGVTNEGGNPLAGRSMIWTPMSGLIDLTGQVDNLSSSIVLHSATQITEDGQILAIRYAPVRNSTELRRYYYHLQPVPEPGTMAALGLGVAALLRRRKKSR